MPQDRVPEIQARVAEGARLPVTALDRSRTKKLDEGTFSTLDNQVDTQTGTVRAKARFANAGNTLFPNQFVNVQLLLRSVAGAVVVPVTALRHGTSGDFVYVLQDDRTVAVRPVTRGEATVDVIQIASGLRVGERVVTEGGDRVQLADDRGAASGAAGVGRGASGGRGYGASGGRRSGEGRRAGSEAGPEGRAETAPDGRSDGASSALPAEHVMAIAIAASSARP